MRVARSGLPLDEVTTGGDQYTVAVLSYLRRSNVPVIFLEKANSPLAFVKKNLLLRNIWYICHLTRVPGGRDVIVLQDYSQHFDTFMLNLLICLTRRAKLACITQGYYNRYRKSRLKNLLDRMVSWLFFLPMAMVIASSSTMAEDTIALMKVPRHKLRVVYPPLRADFRDTHDTAVDSRFDGDGRPISLLFVGYFRPIKGVEYLLEAFGVLKGQNVELTLVGNSSVNLPYTDKIFAMVEELGIRERVHYVGEIKDVRMLIDLYRKADILVLPSTYESFGIVLAEAMCLGLPIVATGVGGIPELVEDGVNGIVVPPKNALALAEAISTLVNSPSLRQQMGQKGYEKSFQWRCRTAESVGKECHQALLELLQE